MSKYDCSKTMDYAHERNRMCDADKSRSCYNCPLKGVGESCFHIRFITQEHIDIIQKWSDEHPEKTRHDAYIEIFPKMREFDPHRICFANMIGVHPDEIKMECAELGCMDCWNLAYCGEFEKAREE